MRIHFTTNFRNLSWIFTQDPARYKFSFQTLSLTAPQSHPSPHFMYVVSVQNSQYMGRFSLLIYNLPKLRCFFVSRLLFLVPVLNRLMLPFHIGFRWPLHFSSVVGIIFFFVSSCRNKMVLVVCSRCDALQRCNHPTGRSYSDGHCVTGPLTLSAAIKCSD